jgi:hypothetical protein
MQMLLDGEPGSEVVERPEVIGMLDGGRFRMELLMKGFGAG